MGNSNRLRVQHLKARLLYAALMLSVTGWMLWKHGPQTLVDLILIVAVILTFFCGPKERPFWFLWGIAVGVILTATSINHSWKLW
jgi:hypothetical protein